MCGGNIGVRLGLTWINHVIEINNNRKDFNKYNIYGKLEIHESKENTGA